VVAGVAQQAAGGGQGEEFLVGQPFGRLGDPVRRRSRPVPALAALLVVVRVELPRKTGREPGQVVAQGPVADPQFPDQLVAAARSLVAILDKGKTTSLRR